ncbi:MAG: hypothetical protein ACKOGI_09480 [Vulcanococcus sp.]
MAPSAAAPAPLPQRSLLGSGVLLLCGLALCPLVGLGLFALQGSGGLTSLRLGSEGPLQVGGLVLSAEALADRLLAELT